MASITWKFHCPNEDCEEALEMEVSIDSYGSPGTSASLSYPGDPPEGPDLSAETADFPCPKCGERINTDVVVNDNYDAIIEKMADNYEPDYPEYDHD